MLKILILEHAPDFIGKTLFAALKKVAFITKRQFKMIILLLSNVPWIAILPMTE
jgi:hypothetical protein